MVVMKAEDIYKDIENKYIKFKYENPKYIHIDNNSFAVLWIMFNKVFKGIVEKKEDVLLDIEKGRFDENTYIMGMSVKILNIDVYKVILSYD